MMIIDVNHGREHNAYMIELLQRQMWKNKTKTSREKAHEERDWSIGDAYSS
jgi:hypothetical protein